jgi:tetratricopeptide (TPR) repeat protein
VSGGEDDSRSLDKTLSPARPEGGGRTGTALEAGRTLGRYVVLERLGAGGWGEVYAAFDPALDRKVALKILRADRAGAEGGPARLLREAHALARLQHPNIVAIHDAGMVEDEVFMAMELVSGQPLDAWLKERPRTWREVLEVFLAAGEGLHAAHRAGLVHRDFKPANVQVGDDGRVRVLDFGLARSSEETTLPDRARAAAEAAEAAEVPVPGSTPLGAVTRAGVVMGTPGYMAPEQIEALPVDARSDQFSFAVSLFQALYGQKPFHGDTLAQFAQAVRARRVAPAPRDRHVPEWIHRILLRALSADPGARFPDMRALLDALKVDPGRARRRWAAAALALVVAGVAGGGYAALARAQARRCAEVAADLGGAWTSAERAAVRAALIGTRRPFAEDAWKGSAAALDAYARHWGDMRAAVCEAGEARTASRLQLGCLERRRQEASALIAVLSAADGPVVENAVKAARGLPDLRDCADATALAARAEDEPADEAARQRAAELQARLAEARALLDSGQYPRGAKVATEAAANASGALRAELLHVLAKLQERTGDFRGSEETLHSAAEAALAVRADDLAARAWIMLVAVVGARLGQPEQAARWERYARAAVDRAGQLPTLQAELHNHLGIMATYRGQYERAVSEYREAIRIWEVALGPAHPQLAAPINNLGIVLSRQGKFDEALAAHERALKIRIAAFGPNHPEVGASENNLGAACQRTGDYEEARQHYQRAYDIHSAAGGPEAPQAVDSLYNLGELSLKLNDVKRAAETCAQTAQLIGKRLGPDHPSRANSVACVARAHLMQGKLGDALAGYQEAYRIFLKGHPPSHPDAAAYLTDIGESYLAMNRPREAIQPLEQALAIREAQALEPYSGGRTRFMLAQALWDTSGRAGRLRARELAEASLAALQKAGPRAGELAGAVEAWLATHRP